MILKLREDLPPKLAITEPQKEVISNVNDPDTQEFHHQLIHMTFLECLEILLMMKLK
jgi:hypothetical protein